MKTKIYDLTDKSIYDEAIKQAALAVKKGGVVVFPTETVYGIGADAFNVEAIHKIFQAKNRPLDNPLIVHFADKKDINLAASNISDNALKVSEKFMPGPITIVCHKQKNIPSCVTACLDTVAVRVPMRESARDLIRACQTPLVAPSANISGKPSPTAPEHVIEDMNGKVDVILIEGRCDVGLESTVVDFTSGEKARILRPGGVTPEQLKQIILLEDSYKPVKQLSVNETPKAPGMKYKHYKPNAKVVCLMGDEKKIVDYINNRTALENNLTAAAVFEHLKEKISCDYVFSLGNKDIPQEAGNLLFYNLRKADEVHAGIIFVMCTDYKGIGLAYHNRLEQASDEIITF